MFYFQTPYYGYDELFLDAAERTPVIDELLACLRERLPVLNSRADCSPCAPPVDASLAGRRGRRRGRRDSVCCRAPDSCCEDCGYAACTEIAKALRLRPSAVRAMGRLR